MEKYIEEALAAGYIHPSTSPAAAGFFFVEKKDSGLHPYINYRGLNAIIIQYPYPLPLVPVALAELWGAKVFTKLDPQSAYNLISINEGDKRKAAFHSNTGHYEYLADKVEALRYCRNHHHDLVSVRTVELQLWVKEVARNASTEHMWLGLRHTCALGFWYWVNGEMICYQDWAPSNRTGFKECIHEERTGAVQSGGEQKWISLPQSEKLNYIYSTYESLFY
ncbi:hypothetical protein QTP70_008667 [Hemibagrus guttatus]|uniref:C-type lectin domain-containing protein n=1 Tax=Hemibagrus guttatus TaxID=175788 RepID=A0AAE0PYL8_9TELE|nr:hypothetical protein QTP70_008667 [Hemibagrus guttatus]